MPVDEATMERWLREQLDQIRPFDETASERSRLHADRLTKPVGSLGRLEHIAAQLAGISGKLWPDLSRRAVVVMAGDHGVAREGVSAYPQEVTRQMTLNFAAGGAAVNVLARQTNAEVICVDVGVAADIVHPGIASRKIVRGTANMANGPAMSRQEALRAIWAGVEVAREASASGVAMFACGEMGIGNTTPSAALAVTLAGLTLDRAVGRGTGIGDEALARKRHAVERAIAVNRPDCGDAIDALAKVGGAEIAALTGLFIGAAACGCPAVVDGYISSVAALVAVRLSDKVKPYLIASHLSQESGHGDVLEALGLEPIMRLDMRLGEGTGATLCFHFIDAALQLMREMATFDSAGISGAGDGRGEQ